MTRPLIALVLAGGTGTRLYPASRPDHPKQFLSFDDNQSLLSRTVDRLSFADEVVVCTGERHADRVREHAPEVSVFVEPAAKDTGPALVYATHRIREQFGECVVFCAPSDHHVAGCLESTARTAVDVAVETNGLITIGVEPTRPATEYGYVQPGAATDGGYHVEQFREKPDQETASRFIEDGFYWNAGMFAWTPSALLQAARATTLSPLVDALDDGDAETGFDSVDPVSVDYAIMEGASDVFVVPAEFEWDDLGSWDAVGRIFPTDDEGNTVIGDALTIDANDNVVVGEDTSINLVGVDDLVVVAVDDSVLVVPRDQAQRVRDVAAERTDD